MWTRLMALLLLLCLTGCLAKTVTVEKPCLYPEPPEKPLISFVPADGDWIKLSLVDARNLLLYLQEVNRWEAEVARICGND